MSAPETENYGATDKSDEAGYHDENKPSPEKKQEQDTVQGGDDSSAPAASASLTTPAAPENTSQVQNGIKNPDLAPGNKMLSIDSHHGGCIHLQEPKQTDLYSPSVDFAFTTAAQAFPGSVLGVALTGMGQDGLLGSKVLKQTHSRLWAQDQASSVIYGMPMAVAKANLTDSIYSLGEISEHLISEVC